MIEGVMAPHDLRKGVERSFTLISETNVHSLGIEK
jgi:hypothetical protein